MSLVITIIVMLILAGVSLSFVFGDNSVLKQAQTATDAYRFAAYKEQLGLILNKDMTCAGESLKKYIPNIDENDLDKFVIINGTLAFIGDDEAQKEIAESIGIDTGFSENATMDDVVNITEKLFEETKDVTLPESDTDATPEGLYGKRLYDKSSLNMETWNLVIDYDKNNKEKARYGSGYYLLEPGTYKINGEDIEIKGKYILDYKKNTLIGISERAVEWSIDTTLAVKTGLVLNIDPTNLADGKWTGITKYGDVTYDASSKSLVFNKSADNTAGEGGYLQLSRNNVDFKNGFTFEIYAKLDRLAYNNNRVNNQGLGMFCRMPSLTSAYQEAMRFGYTQAKTLCKFHSVSSWNGKGDGTYLSTSSGSVIASQLGYNVNEDFYMTLVYNRTDDDLDKVEYYINGELLGYTYYGKDSYNLGLNTWNNSACPFFIGVTPWHKDGNLYYLKGNVYSCRLYTTSMTEEQVKDNMDMTQKYRSSF